MAEDPAALLTLASAGLMATGIASAAALRGWQAWLELKRAEIEGRGVASPHQIIGGLRRRVRRLEAIANGEAASTLGDAPGRAD